MIDAVELRHEARADRIRFVARFLDCNPNEPLYWPVPLLKSLERRWHRKGINWLAREIHSLMTPPH